jgi:hypothetical protein
MVHGGVARGPDAEACELGVDAAGEDEGKHAVLAEQGPDGVAERGRPVALHEDLAVPIYVQAYNYIINLPYKA